MWNWLVASGTAICNWTVTSLGQTGSWAVQSLKDCAQTIQTIGASIKF